MKTCRLFGKETMLLGSNVQCIIFPMIYVKRQSALTLPAANLLLVGFFVGSWPGPNSSPRQMLQMRVNRIRRLSC